MVKRKADILLLGLLVLVINIIGFLALLHYAPKVTQQNPQPAQPPQSTPQPPVTSKPKPKIVATIQSGEGGSVLANGTATPVWSSTSPFSLRLEAVPKECYALDYWEVNGSRVGGDKLTLTIAGNTTIRPVFKRPLYTLSLDSNAVGAPIAVNGTIVKVPFTKEFPCGTTVKIVMFPLFSETVSYTPSGFLVNYEDVSGSELVLRISGNLTVSAVYKIEAYTLYIDTNAPGVKVLVDGQEVTLPARIQRAKPFTVVIQAPPLVKVNDTFAWGSPEFQARDYIRGVLTWVTFATGKTAIHIEEAEKTIRVYYHPLYSLGKDTYVTPLFGKVYVEGNTIIAEPDKYYVYTVNIILPPNWTKAMVRVESSLSLGAVIMFPYNKNGNIYDEVDARVDAQRGVCTTLTVVFEVVRSPPSARVVSYYCNGGKVDPDQYYTQGPWNFGQGNEQYLGRLIVVDGDGSNVRIYVQVEG
jgi:hypothetical protein